MRCVAVPRGVVQRNAPQRIRCEQAFIQQSDVLAYHAQQKLLRPVPESCLLIVLGIFVGVLLYLADGANSDRHQLDTGTFFFVLLPPIIIDAGYFMPTRSFFDQLGTIVLYAVIGTMVRPSYN